MKKPIAIILSIMLVLAITLPAAAISAVAVKSIKLNSSDVTLKVGQTHNLKATLTPANTTQKLLTYTTSNKKIATVDKNGKITAVRAGTTVIQVFSSFNTSIVAKCNVTISKSDSAKKTKLKMWVRGSGQGGPYYELMQEFNSSQSEIVVEYENIGENFPSLINLAFQSGNPPDIFTVATTIPPVNVLAAAGKIAPVGDLLSAEFKTKFHPSSFTQRDFYYNGELYTIPLRITKYALLYNKDIFKKAGLDPNRPPQTLEELRDYAKKITVAGKGEFYGVPYMLGGASQWLRYIDYLAVAHGDVGVNGFDFKTGKFDFSSYKKYFDFWLQLKKDGSVLPGELSLGVEVMRANFAQGKVGMYSDASFMTTQYATVIKTDADWDAAPLPLFQGAKRAKDYMAMGINFVIARQSKDIEATKVAYKYMLENQGYLRKFGDADTKTFLEANNKKWLDLLPKDIKFNGMNEMNDVSGAAAFPLEPHKFIKLEGDTYEKVLTNLYAQAVDGKTIDVEKALQDVTKRYNKALDKAVGQGLIAPALLKPKDFDYFNR